MCATDGCWFYEVVGSGIWMPIGRLINRADTHAAWLSHHHFRVQRDEGTGSTSVPSLNLSAEDVRLTFRPWYRKNDFTPPNNTLSRLIPKALYLRPYHDCEREPFLAYDAGFETLRLLPPYIVSLKRECMEPTSQPSISRGGCLHASLGIRTGPSADQTCACDERDSYHALNCDGSRISTSAAGETQSSLLSASTVRATPATVHDHRVPEKRTPLNVHHPSLQRSHFPF